MIVQKLLFILPNLEYGSLAAQCVQLLLALPAGQFQRRICVLGRSGPWAERLRQAGIAVDTPGRGRLLDLKPLVHLRRLASEFAPDVVHVWGRSALRLVALSGFAGRLITSPWLGADVERSWLRRLDGWLLRKARHVVAFGEIEAERCRGLGVDASRLVVVRPAVKLDRTEAAPQQQRFILCIGRLEAHKGFLDALWAHDILRYVHPELRLVIAGAGPERERLQRFAAGLESTGRVDLLGAVPDVGPLLRQAEMVWSPGRCETGTQVILEAMAAGKPVVASRIPRLAELVVDGETGFLVPVEDKALLARQTQQLLSDPALCKRMGETGQRRVAEHFAPELLAETCARLYKE